MVGTAAAQDDTENGNVTVSVAEDTAIDIQPANLNYSDQAVGTRASTSERGFDAIEIENTGSTYVDQIWLNSSAPATDPFGTGFAPNYDAGNFIEVRPQDDLTSTTDAENWHFVNRREFTSSGEGNYPSYIQLPSGESANWEVGQFRRGDESIYFVINHGGTCNGGGTNTYMRVGNVSSTDNRLGTVDFSSSTEYGWVEYGISDAPSFDMSYGISGTVQDTGGEPETGDSDLTSPQGVALNWSDTRSAGDSYNNYDVMTHCDDTGGIAPQTVRTRYNINAGGADDLSSTGDVSNFLLSATGTSGMLYPGASETIRTTINVPEGVAEGQVDPGTLRVLVSADLTQTPRESAP